MLNDDQINNTPVTDLEVLQESLKLVICEGPRTMQIDIELFSGYDWASTISHSQNATMGGMDSSVLRHRLTDGSMVM